MSTETESGPQDDGGARKIIRKITVTRNGPYQVAESIPLEKQSIVADADGVSREWRKGESIDAPAVYRLCRCGQSAKKPFCDGTHAKIGFDGTEVASRKPYLEQAKVFEGPERNLTDARSLCASARFCDPDGGIWTLIKQTNDSKVRELVRRMAGNCPSGRLIAWDRSTAHPDEPELEESIVLVQDPSAGVSGPLWVRGGITIQATDGEAYEVRGRVTLCRCGASKNKPFCDGSHVATGFRDVD